MQVIFHAFCGRMMLLQSQSRSKQVGKFCQRFLWFLDFFLVLGFFFGISVFFLGLFLKCDRSFWHVCPTITIMISVKTGRGGNKFLTDLFCWKIWKSPPLQTQTKTYPQKMPLVVFWKCEKHYIFIPWILTYDKTNFKFTLPPSNEMNS